MVDSVGAMSPMAWCTITTYSLTMVMTQLVYDKLRYCHGKCNCHIITLNICFFIFSEKSEASAIKSWEYIHTKIRGLIRNLILTKEILIYTWSCILIILTKEMLIYTSSCIQDFLDILNWTLYYIFSKKSFKKCFLVIGSVSAL